MFSPPKYLCLLVLIIIHFCAFAVENEEIYQRDSLLQILESVPSFGIYKENYFVTGVNRIKPFSRTNCNAKFQISVKQRLTKSVLPFKTYLFFTYTQKSMWNIYQPSCPFEDNNYSPAVGIGKYFISDKKVTSEMSLMFVHESNGLGGTSSRSWNRLVFHTMFPLNANSNIQFQMWLPFIKHRYNKNYLEYSGLGAATYNIRTPRKNFVFSLTVMKRAYLDFSFNFTLEASYKIPFFSNQYVFLQVYSGYAEYMLCYNEYRNSIRIGLSFKPKFFGLY